MSKETFWTPSEALCSADTKEETAKRVMIFFFGNLAASASSNLLSYGILQMAGIAGRPGWFWLCVQPDIAKSALADLYRRKQICHHGWAILDVS